MEERRALNIPLNALLSPKKGGMSTKIAGRAIKLLKFMFSANPANVAISPLMKNIGMLSTIIRLTALSFDFNPFMAHTKAKKTNKNKNKVDGDNQPPTIFSSRLKFNNKILARNKEGMVTMSPAEVIIGDEMLSISQFLRYPRIETRIAMPRRMIPEIKPPITEMRMKAEREILCIPNAFAAILAKKPRITERMSDNSKEAYAFWCNIPPFFKVGEKRPRCIEVPNLETSAL